MCIENHFELKSKQMEETNPVLLEVKQKAEKCKVIISSSCSPSELIYRKISYSCSRGQIPQGTHTVHNLLCETQIFMHILKINHAK